jgi:spore germination protein GerM
VAAAAVAVAALLAACGGSTGGGSSSGDATTPSTGTPPATATGAAATQPATTASGPSHDVTLWFVKDGKPASVTRTAPQTRAVARQSLELLLAGPTAEERAQG